MFRNRLGVFVCPQFFGPGDMGGGDSGGGAPSGGNVDPGAASGGGSPTAGNEPQVFDASDDTLIRIKGQDKPVKFGDHVKGFQSQFTKASQRAAQLEAKLREESAARQRYEQELQQFRQQGQQKGQGDVYDALRQLPYLTGEHAVEVVQSIGQQLQQRDQVLLATLKQLKEMKQIVNGLHQSSSSSAFEAKLDKFVADAGLGKEYGNFARELYLAYEGDDLDQEFPRILSERVEELRKAFSGERERKIREARPQPFVPGRGGNTGPTKPLEIKPGARASEIADLLFPGLQDHGGT